MKKIFVITFCVLTSFIHSQVTPSSYGKTYMATAFGFGVEQNLNDKKINRWKSSTKIQFATVSTLKNRNPFNRFGYAKFSQEFSHYFHEKWSYSVGLGYKGKTIYESTPPFSLGNPNIRQDFTLNAKLSHLFKTPRLEITPTIRAEFIKYYAERFNTYPDKLKLRLRADLKLTFHITSDKVHRLIFISDFLFSTIQKQVDHNHWTKFKYDDTRIILYYSYSPQSIPFTFNLGYMNTIIGTKNVFSGSYLAFDVIWNNPFHIKSN